MSDCSAEDPARSSADLQSQDRLHQHPGRRAAGGDAVSEVLLKALNSSASFFSSAALCSVPILQLDLYLKWKRITGD